jgi:hypothetical protein
LKKRPPPLWSSQRPHYLFNLAFVAW